MILRKAHHKGLRAKGKSSRSKQNTKWAAELKQWWIDNDMPQTCELRFIGCMDTFGLALCHSLKRRFITTREQYFEVCAGCVQCHKVLDERNLTFSISIKLGADRSVKSLWTTTPKSHLDFQLADPAMSNSVHL